MFFYVSNITRSFLSSKSHLALNICKSTKLNLHCSPVVLAVDKVLLSKLRKQTGFPISHCKKALEIHNDDIKKADEWLQKEAQAHGWSKASKLSGRATTQGLVGIHVEGNVAGLVELNCETDFVARNSEFRDLLKVITKEFTLSQSSTDSSENHSKKECFEKESLSEIKTSDGTPVGDLVALAIGKTGENIQLRRGVKFTCSPELKLVGYTHPPNPASELLGKFGAVVAFKNISDANVMRELCAHIIGFNPKSIGIFDETKVDKNNSTSSRIASSEDSDDEQNKEEVREDNAEEIEDKPLVYQNFLSDQDLTVGEVLKENNIDIIDFVRLGCGESTESSSFI